jgi:hypothetical protein
MAPWTFGRRLFSEPYGDELSQLLRDVSANFPAFGTARQKIPEDPAEPRAVAAIVPPLRLQDVVDDELSDSLLTLSTAKQLTAQLKSDHRRDVLMSGNGIHFAVGQSSQAEAIFEC